MDGHVLLQQGERHLHVGETRRSSTACCANDWGFDGLVMTDWFGGRDAVAQMKAGNDLLMPGMARQQEALLAALASGALPEAVLDRNVTRILELIRRSPSFLGSAHSDAPDLEGPRRWSPETPPPRAWCCCGTKGARSRCARRRSSPSSATPPTA